MNIFGRSSHKRGPFVSSGSPNGKQKKRKNSSSYQPFQSLQLPLISSFSSSSGNTTNPYSSNDIFSKSIKRNVFSKICLIFTSFLCVLYFCVSSILVSISTDSTPSSSASASISKTQSQLQYQYPKQLDETFDSRTYSPPRKIAILGDSIHDFNHIHVLNPYAMKYPTKRNPSDNYMIDPERQKKLEQSRDYYKHEKDTWVTSKCKPMEDWQLTSFPTCNKLHELDLVSEVSYGKKEELGLAESKIINHGYFRDVWRVKDTNPLFPQHTVLKTLRYEHKYIDRNYDRHRRDGVAMERLTFSPFILNIYGYCGNNGFFEFSEAGDIDNALFAPANKGKLSKYDRLRIATQIAQGLADAHYFTVEEDPSTGEDVEGYATIAHTDITGGQFIFVDGIFKLNDFNRARFIRWNEKENEPCSFRVGVNRGDFRSPEEYMYTEETEKVDVYSMGNIFYQLYSLNYYLFGNITDDTEIAKMVKKGQRPDYNSLSIGSIDDPKIDHAFQKAIEMCYIQDPNERASAREVADFLLDELEKIPYPQKVDFDQQQHQIDKNMNKSPIVPVKGKE